jgi:2-oxoisovalerate dehydrogenase E2 component (dihydrolipoyl transacylase)
MTASAPTISVTMPKLGESVVEGTLVRWLKGEGDTVALYEPLAEVITDKVNTEIPSPVAGTLARLSIGEGQTVAVGVEIAQITPEGAAVSPPSTDDFAEEQTAAVASGEASPPDGGADAMEGATVTQAAEDSRQRTSPLVRRLAREHAIDLSQVPGTGTGGRVRKEDILAYLETRPAAQPAAPQPQAVTTPVETATTTLASVPTAGDEDVLPLSPMRRAIAEHMVRSLQTSPHTWTYVETDVSGLVRRRAAEREAFRQREGFDLTYVPFICKAVVETLREHPILNSTWRDGQVVLKKRINLGVAVALEENLVVPVIKDADRLNVAGLAHALNDLVQRARSNQLRPDDVQGGTFTLNNTGALGSILSQPIINQPQAAILTMEAIQKRVVVTPDDAIAVRPMMNVCISFDHRITDGLQVGRFMQSLKRRIEALGEGGSLY